MGSSDNEIVDRLKDELGQAMSDKLDQLMYRDMVGIPDDLPDSIWDEAKQSKSPLNYIKQNYPEYLI